MLICAPINQGYFTASFKSIIHSIDCSIAEHLQGQDLAVPQKGIDHDLQIMVISKLLPDPAAGIIHPGIFFITRVPWDKDRGNIR